MPPAPLRGPAGWFHVERRNRHQSVRAVTSPAAPGAARRVMARYGRRARQASSPDVPVYNPLQPRRIAMRRFAFATTLVALIVSGSFGLRSTAAPAPTRLLRQPTVSADRVAFLYASNVWVVERSGGLARRITSFPGSTANPEFSPDGRWIAFTGDYGGNSDVYIVPAQGGGPKRLTWDPGADTPPG